MNMYAYVGNDPMNRTDPSGMISGIGEHTGPSGFSDNGTGGGGGGFSNFMPFDGFGGRGFSQYVFCAGPGCFGGGGIELPRGPTNNKIDNTSTPMKVAKFAAKAAQTAYDLGGASLLDAVGLVFREVQTVFSGLTGTAVGGVGATAAVGVYLDMITGEEGSFYTVGAGAGVDASGGWYFGGINAGADRLAGPFLQVEADVPTPTLVGPTIGGLIGLDRCCIDGNLQIDYQTNDVRGWFLGLGAGAGVAATITYTWLWPS